MKTIVLSLCVTVGLLAQEQSGSAQAQPAMPAKVTLWQYLRTAGSELGCRFTLESDSHTENIPGPNNEMEAVQVPDEIQYDTIAAIYPHTAASLIKKLNHELPSIDVFPEPEHPNIIHLVARSLERRNDYVMDRKISLTADLVPDELVRTLGKMLDHKIDCPPLRAIGDYYGDTVTKLYVSATNQTVRQVLSDYFPSQNAGPFLWTSVGNLQRYTGFSQTQVKYAYVAPGAVAK